MKRLLWCLVLLSAAVGAQDSPSLTVVGTVLNYKVGDYVDHYDDGMLVYDTSEILVESPTSRRGQRLVIVHSYPPATDSPYRRIKKRVRFSLAADAWDVSGVVQDGSVLSQPEEI